MQIIHAFRSNSLCQCLANDAHALHQACSLVSECVKREFAVIAAHSRGSKATKWNRIDCSHDARQRERNEKVTNCVAYTKKISKYLPAKCMIVSLQQTPPLCVLLRIALRSDSFSVNMYIAKGLSLNIELWIVGHRYCLLEQNYDVSCALLTAN